MRKPLQKKNEFAESFKNSSAMREGHLSILYKVTENGEFIFRNTGDVSFLIETANKWLREEDSKKSHNPEFGYLLGVWMGRLVAKGFSSQMLSELRSELGRIRFFHELNPAIPSRGKPLPHWVYIADTEDFVDPRKKAAYVFAHQLTIDGFAGLRRCLMRSCKKFFIGRPNAKWCSDACGSKHRVAQMRKRARNSQ